MQKTLLNVWGGNSNHLKTGCDYISIENLSTFPVLVSSVHSFRVVLFKIAKCLILPGGYYPIYFVDKILVTRNLSLSVPCYYLTNFKTIFHMWKNQVDGFHQENMWKTAVEELWPASLLKTSLFHWCFSHILLVKTNTLVSL